MDRRNLKKREKSKENKKAGTGKKVLVAIIAGSLLWGSVSADNLTTVQAAQAQSPSIQLVSEQPITAGAVLRKYVWHSIRGNTTAAVNANVIVADLQNPYVKLDVMTGVNNQFTKRQDVPGMVKASGAAAGVNGDYFSTGAEGAPIGPEIESGIYMSSPSTGINGMYAFGLTQDRKPVIDSFAFKGTVMAANGVSYALAGINNTYYWDDNHQHSHANKLYIYTNAWGSTSRANDGATTPTEVLVENGTVKQIAVKDTVDSVPPVDGYIIRAAGKAADFVTQNLHVGDRVSYTYQMVSNTTKQAVDPSLYQMMIGGHTILVDQGKPAAFSRNVSSLGGNRSRTGIGYSKDGRYVYILTADNSGNSDGMSLSDFQQLMTMVGVWKGLNLDGGGSTQMVARPLGDFTPELANDTEYGSTRKVVNGLGVYSTAPQGKLKGILLQGNSLLFIGEQTQFDFKAYDQFYNPLSTSNLNVQWTWTKGLGTFDKGAFTALNAGKGQLSVQYGGVKQEKELEVVGRDQIASLQMQAPDHAVLVDGGKYKLKVTAVTLDGTQREVPAELIDWQLIGFKGTINGNTLTVDRLTGAEAGQIIASYDGFSTLLTIPFGIDKMWADFDQLNPSFKTEKTPSDVSGQVRLVTSLPGTDGLDRALYFDYNFREGTGTKALYAAFGDNGAAVEGTPIKLKARIFGDNSLNWVRAEVIDRNGQKQMLDFTRHLDWYGWKEVSEDLSGYNLAFPIKVSRVYIVDPQTGQDEREVMGTTAIDNIRFEYIGKVPETKKVKVSMAVNRKTINVDGKDQSLDQAPVVIKGNTLIPIRFFVDAMGGNVMWDGKENKVTILKGSHLVELWIGKQDLIIDGRRVTADVAPALMHNRSMLPLRLISESLGWTVDWDNRTKSIVLQ